MFGSGCRTIESGRPISKVFLYPENWIEPELRDDKTPFFRELESELLQTDITIDTAESALGNFVDKVDSVSQLEICGMCEQVGFAADEKREHVLHVFGRTFATPRILYYRQQVTQNANYKYWTPWEKVPLDVQADEVLPVIWNRRLYVFWQVASETQDGIKTNTWIRLAWSAYRQGKWSAKRVTSMDDAVFAGELTTPPRMNAYPTGDALTIVLEISLKNFINKEEEAGKRNGHMVTALGSLTFHNYGGKVSANVAKAPKVTYREGYLAWSDTKTATLDLRGVVQEGAVPVFAHIQHGVALFAPGSEPYTLDAPFFVQEGPRTYVVSAHSFEQSGAEQRLTNGVMYLPGPGAKAGTGATAPAKQMAQMTLTANSWLGGRAALGATEFRVASAGASRGLTAPMTDLSLDTRLFHDSVAKLAPVSLRVLPAELRFETFFHPYTPEFQRRLSRYGVAGLLRMDSQQPTGAAQVVSFETAYEPGPIVKGPLPKHTVDFEIPGAYSVYNWELFFHIRC